MRDTYSAAKFGASTPLRDYTVRGQSNVWCLPKYWPPTPSPPGECVPPLPSFGAEGGHTRWVERGGGSIFWKTPDTVLYSTYVSTLCCILFWSLNCASLHSGQLEIKKSLERCLPEERRDGVDISDEDSDLADADGEGEGADRLVARWHHRHRLQERDYPVLSSTERRVKGQRVKNKGALSNPVIGLLLSVRGTKNPPLERW